MPLIAGTVALICAGTSHGQVAHHGRYERRFTSNGTSAEDRFGE